MYKSMTSGVINTLPSVCRATPEEEGGDDDGIKTLPVVKYSKVNRLRLGGGCVSDNPVDNPAVVPYIFPFSSSDIGITHIIVNCVIVIFVNELLQYRVDNSKNYGR